MKKWLLLFCLVSTLHAADDEPWTWKDRTGVVRSRPELDSILQEHRKWVDTKGKEGKQADLRGAILPKANLSGASLEEALLYWANLSGANLSKADLRKADLGGAILPKADLSGAHLSGANLSKADLNEAFLGGADLKWANLRKADLGKADLAEAHLYGADLEEALLYWANLSKAGLGKADLSGASLGGADLAEAYVGGANFKGAFYAPKHHPPMSVIAQADGLGNLTWDNDSEPIYSLRKSFSDAGFVGPARQVNAAIHRHKQTWLERFLFDWTCEWGANWLRPLAIAAVLSLLCTLIYWIGMHFHTKSGLYLSATGERIATAKGRERVIRIAVRPSRTAPATDQLEFELEPKPQVKGSPAKSRQRRWEMTALGTAFLFSLMSVFNIGFREFNFGRWIRMLQPREFDIRARGWMRTVSGIQSLIGIAMLALSLLSYFGNPFD